MNKTRLNSIATFIIVSLLFLSACQKANSSPKLKLLSDQEYKEIMIVHEDMSIKRKIIPISYICYSDVVQPLKLLQFLATEPKDVVYMIRKRIKMGSIEQTCSGIISKQWVTKEDVSELMKYIKSRQPASPSLYNEAVSYFIKTSTVGIEAMAIISFYRGASYPPTQGERESRFNTKNQNKLVEEYLEWWELEQNKR